MEFNYFLCSLILKDVIVDKKKFYNSLNEHFNTNKEYKNNQKNNYIKILGSSLRHFYFFKMLLKDELNISQDSDLFFNLSILLTDLFFTKRYKKELILEEISKLINNNDVTKFINLIANNTPYSILDKKFNNKINELYISIRFNIPIWLIKMWNKHYSKKDTLKICKSINSKHNNFCLLNNLIKNDVDLKNNKDFLYDEKYKFYQYVGKSSLKTNPMFVNDLIYETNLINNEVINQIKVDVNDTLVMYYDVKNTFYYDILNKFNKDNIICFFSSDFTKLSKSLQNIRKYKNDLIFYSQKEINNINASLPKLANIFVLIPKSSNLSYYYTSPDYLINFDNNKINEIIKEQKDAMENCIENIASDGYLIYITYTLNKKENDRLIEEFILQHNNFSLINQKTFIPNVHDNNFGYYAILKKIK